MYTYDCSFLSSVEFASSVPVYQLRLLPAFLGSVLVPVIYQVTVELGLSRWASLIAGAFIVFGELHNFAGRGVNRAKNSGFASWEHEFLVTSSSCNTVSINFKIHEKEDPWNIVLFCFFIKTSKLISANQNSDSGVILRQEQSIWHLHTFF